MTESVEIPVFTLHAKKIELNPKLDLRHKEAAVTIELSHIKARTLIQDLEKALVESKGAIRFKVTGTRGDY